MTKVTVVFKCGYELKIECESYRLEKTPAGKIKNITFEPVGSHQPKPIFMDVNEIILVTTER